jgi:selenium metabolism protein YedF
MATLDARGMECPKPLILVKKALNNLESGQTLDVLIDNETSKQNVERFCKDNGVLTSSSLDGNVFTLTLTKRHKEFIVADEKRYCTPETGRAPHVIAIPGKEMGQGPAELGAILMKAFVNTIKEIAPLPSHIVFYNTGVELTVEGSPLLEPLLALEKMGVTILSCGTCLDYFGVKAKLSVGAVSNMFTILEILSDAGSVVKP